MSRRKKINKREIELDSRFKDKNISKFINIIMLDGKKTIPEQIFYFILEKISKGRIEKFKQENTLLNQYWVIDPKKKVKEILEDFKSGIIIKNFVRYKIGE